jgi:hypothetical protein
VSPSTAFDPGSGTFFLHNDNLTLRNLMAVDVKTGEERELSRCADRRDRVQPGRPLAHGHPALERRRDAVRIPYPYTTWVDVHTFPGNTCPTDLDISPTGDCCRRR